MGKYATRWYFTQAILTPVGNVAAEDEAAKALRKLACDLRSKVGSVPYYEHWAKCSRGFLPTQKDALEASKLLIGLSNSVHQDHRSEKNAAQVSKIKQLLGYEPIDE